MIKCALYARVSTKESTDKQNPENQLIRLRSFAEARGEEVSREYVDYASGANPDRPQFREMMEASRRREISAILVVKLDRVMRSTKHLLETVEYLNSWSVSLVCLDQPIETGSAMGRMVITILGAIAEFERSLISERTRDGLARTDKKGGRTRRKISSTDIALAREMRQKGASWKIISDAIGIPPSTIRDRLAENGGV